MISLSTAAVAEAVNAYVEIPCRLAGETMSTIKQVGLAMMGISGNSFLNKPNFRYSGLNELPHSFRPSMSLASRL